MNLKNTAVSMILEAGSFEELEEIKLDLLGKSGKLTTLMKEMAKLPPERRPEVGRIANEVKTIIEDTLENAEGKFTQKRKNEAVSQIDVTDPGIRPPLGHLHPVTQAIEEISKIFERIGFYRVRYPEIEWDWYAFEALNFPDNHPARDDWETFFIDQEPHPKFGPVVLTPHTSSGQIREIERILSSEYRKKKEEAGESHTIEIKMLNIAKTYRRQSDVSHTPMFHQFETLVVGKNISIAHLKGTLDYFVKSYFGSSRKSRIRPYHFQFTEPSFETDVSCGVCNGTGMISKTEKCRLCKEGWLELGGAGMVHPNVLKNCGIDPSLYTGFASGWGVERVLMMKEGMELDDLRILYANNLEFLEQF
jgi:phenylalanyl-tRNA synthetase alpha chain